MVTVALLPSYWSCLSTECYVSGHTIDGRSPIRAHRPDPRRSPNRAATEQGAGWVCPNGAVRAASCFLLLISAAEAGAGPSLTLPPCTSDRTVP